MHALSVQIKFIKSKLNNKAGIQELFESTSYISLIQYKSDLTKCLIKKSLRRTHMQ